MKETPIEPIEVEGRPFEVFVTGEGEFAATYEGERYKSETLVALKSKLRNMLRRKTVRVCIPVTVPRGSNALGKTKLVDGDLTGMHSSNGNLLFKSDKTTEQLASYHNDIYRRLTDDEKAKFAALELAAQQSSDDFEAFKGEIEVDGRDLLKQAWAEKE